MPKNTDGLDSYNVDDLRVTNSRIDVGDDCFAPKPNTTHMFVQNLWCNNTHGVSMGSIGQYPGVKDIIEHGYIENVTLLNGQVSHQAPFAERVVNKIERRPSQSMGRKRRRIRADQQHHVQGHPRREYGSSHRAGPVLLRRQSGRMCGIPFAGQHHRHHLRQYLRDVFWRGRKSRCRFDLLA